MEAGDVLGDGELVFGFGSGAVEAEGEDGQVWDLDGVAGEGELFYAGYHVGENSFDGAFGIGGVVVGHVLGEPVEVDGLGDYWQCVPLAVGEVAVELLEIVKKHSCKKIKKLNKIVPAYMSGNID